jgi:sugar O-acyltransferase (sialic acid O-acetyltransferase NeuD family)
VTSVLLVAAGGLARETIAVLQAGAPHRCDLVVVDDDPARWGTELHGVPVVGPLAAVRDHPDHEVLVCAGSGRVRRELVARLSGHGVSADRFASVIHPDVTVPGCCTVGRGSIVLANVTLTADVLVGDHVVVMPGVTLTHDVVVEDYATVCAGVSLGGAVRVGTAAYVGMNASVRQGLGLGAGSTLGMGAVLLEDLPAGETWAGVPAAPVRDRMLQEV